MTILSAELMAEATRLTRAGDTAAATALIQSGLAGTPRPANDGFVAKPSPVAPGTWRQGFAQESAHVVNEPGIREINPLDDPPPVSRTDDSFTDGRFDGRNLSLNYKLFTPGNLSRPAPLLLMLHGCTQDAADFSVGTRMNAIARDAGMIVLYPTQSASANTNKCWNWFEPAHQHRDHGEPAVLSELTRQIINKHQVDARSVFVAGLSAGGAMALIMAEQYPELFAAVGVHSGLPTGAASSVPEALALMRNSHSLAGQSRRKPVGSERTPLIVFHGAQDRTVNVANGRRIVDNWLDGANASDDSVNWVSRSRKECTTSGRNSTVTTYADAEQPDKVACEYWQLAEGGHHWSGGDAAGSHTDTEGPDASFEMTRFFLSSGR